MSLLGALARIFSRPEPIDTLERLETHVSSRAAFIAQKTLYGYLKTRMGTQYPSMFEDDVFVASIDVAKMRVFAACLGDLSVYAVAHALADPGCAPLRAAAARRCHARGLRDNPAPGVGQFSPAKAAEGFERRLAAVDWEGLARTPDAFAQSRDALLRFAPVAPELKALDAEYVGNSIRFAWLDVRRRFLERLDREATAADARRALG